MEKQNTNMKRQRFEATLFSMLNLHFEMRNQIKVKDAIGILAFKEFTNWVLKDAQEAMRINHPDDTINIVRTSCLFGAVPTASTQTDFFTIAEPYLNSLKVIYNSIKQAELKDGAETRYIELMQSYLTNYEVIFIALYYNHLLKKGSEYSLTPMYKDLRIVEFFAYRIKTQYDVDIVVDSSLA